MPDAPGPSHIPAAWRPSLETLTARRDITHAHFTPGDTVVIPTGVADGRLSGDVMTIVAPSWHTPTDEDGWRLRNPKGGDRTFITAHPRYMIHLFRHCPDCLIHRRALEDYVLPKVPFGSGSFGCGWYSLTHLNQLVHRADARGGR
ncbi:hypothetical protein QQY66_33760 [Streptomyces sp. DG2A-72]|uniref:hypothetical protein n=1 Tax=Streptomyces sp. DG2A-72 TaxID=3051386 RepID=UPI00265B9E5A|nr:hypothetical protein [Streptomyces sp. DG2A-72]MDO0936426.1 hypothetical protein [Streptomyces sp. DG2A-72]